MSTPTKVFVGNLAFSTTEQTLSKEFEAAGKVSSANIITRGPRSLGYGFVEMESDESAQNAVRLLNKKEIDGRQINVEVAKPREEGSDNAQPRSNEGGFRGRGGRGGRGGSRGGGFRGGRGGRGGFRGGEEGGRGRGGFRGGRGGFRRRSSSQSGEEGGEFREGEFREGEFRRRPRAPRRDSQKGEDTRTPSKTTLFVANLPFSMDDEGFGKVFKDGSLAFKSVHVVKKRSGRSKGFGFAEFDNEQDQQKALAALNNKSVDGRELVVKVALTEEHREEGNAPAPAPVSSAEGKKEEKKEEKKPAETTPQKK